MLKKAIILLLVGTAAVLFGYVVMRRSQEDRAASVEALQAIPAEDVVVPAKAPADWVRSGRLARGAAVDLCLGRGRAVRAARIHHALCGEDDRECRAFVLVKAETAPAALAGYDLDHPPRIIVAGGAC